MTEARLYRRLLAFLYDALIVLALWLVSGLIALGLHGGDPPSVLTTQVVLICVISGYFTISWVRHGATAGMRAWRLKLVCCDGSKVSAKTACFRCIICLMCLAPLALPLFSKLFIRSDRTIYDKLAQTRVIDLRFSQASTATVSAQEKASKLKK